MLARFTSDVPQCWGFHQEFPQRFERLRGDAGGCCCRGGFHRSFSMNASIPQTPSTTVQSQNSAEASGRFLSRRGFISLGTRGLGTQLASSRIPKRGPHSSWKCCPDPRPQSALWSPSIAEVALDRFRISARQVIAVRRLILPCRLLNIALIYPRNVLWVHTAVR